MGLSHSNDDPEGMRESYYGDSDDDDVLPRPDSYSSKPVNEAFLDRLQDEARRIVTDPRPCPPGDLGSITVRAITDETETFSGLQKETKISHLMRVYQQRSKVPLSQIRLMKMTGADGDEDFELMKPDRTLGSFGLENGDVVVHLFSREPHGLWDRWKQMYF